MTVTNHVYADIATKQDQLIRKALDGSVFIASATATLPTSLTIDGEVTGTPTLAVLPEGYTDFGLISADGAQWSNASSTSDMTSWGRTSPSRRDIVTDVDSLHIIAQETSLATISSYAGVDPSTITPDATTGEVRINKATRPTVVYHRLYGISVDQNAAGEIYIARLMPRASLTSRGDQVYMSGDDGVFYDTTWTAFVDDTDGVGYAMSFLFGGPGWKALLTDMGFGD